MAQEADSRIFLIRLQGETREDYPLLVDVSSFLYDFNLVYEISRTATDKHYSGFLFSEPPWHRPLRDEDRIRVVSLQEHSPLALIAVVAAVPAAVGAIWGLVQIVDKIVNWPLNRQILKLQRNKLLSELQRMEYPTRELQDPEIFRQSLRDHEATHLHDQIVQRLEVGKIRVTDFEITIHEDLSLVTNSEHPRFDE